MHDFFWITVWNYQISLSQLSWVQACYGNKRASCHYNRSVMFARARTFEKFLDGGFSLKVNECGRPCVHVMHWTHKFSFFSILANAMENNWTDRNSQPGIYILVHLRAQLSCWVLTLTLQSKGHVLTSVTLCYQPSFQATIQLTNFLWFIVYFVVIHSLDYCAVMRDGQLLTSLRFIWKLTRLCRVELVSPTVVHSKKVLTIATGMTTAILNGSCTSGFAGLC